MARPQSSDPLHNFRFHVRTAAGYPEFADSEGAEAGFQSVTVPELSNEAVEYRTGNAVYTKKFPGVPTVTDVTMMRGVTKTDTSFYDWMMRSVRGNEYRDTVTIYHFHRDGSSPNHADAFNRARRYVCHEALPIRVKVSSDLEAAASDVSIAELDVACEWFEVENAS